MKIKRSKAIDFILSVFDNDSCFADEVKSYLCDILPFNNLDILDYNDLDSLTNKQLKEIISLI